MHKHGTETTLVFLPSNEETSWSLLPSLVSILSGSTVQPENTYSCILKVTGLRKPKKDNHQHQSQLPAALISISHSQLI